MNIAVVNDAISVSHLKYTKERIAGDVYIVLLSHQFTWNTDKQRIAGDVYIILLSHQFTWNTDKQRIGGDVYIVLLSHQFTWTTDKQRIAGDVYIALFRDASHQSPEIHTDREPLVTRTSFCSMTMVVRDGELTTNINYSWHNQVTVFSGHVYVTAYLKSVWLPLWVFKTNSQTRKPILSSGINNIN